MKHYRFRVISPTGDIIMSAQREEVARQMAIHLRVNCGTPCRYIDAKARAGRRRRFLFW